MTNEWTKRTLELAGEKKLPFTKALVKRARNATRDYDMEPIAVEIVNTLADELERTDLACRSWMATNKVSETRWLRAEDTIKRLRQHVDWVNDH